MFTFFTGSIPSWTLITLTNSKVFCVVAVQFSSLEPGQNERKRVWAGKVMGSTWEGNKVVLPANLLVPWGGRSGPVPCANEQYPSRCWWRIYMCPTPCSAFPIRSHFILPMRGTAIILIFPKRNGTWALGHSQEDAELSHRDWESNSAEPQRSLCACLSSGQQQPRVVFYEARRQRELSKIYPAPFLSHHLAFNKSCALLSADESTS